MGSLQYHVLLKETIAYARAAMAGTAVRARYEKAAAKKGGSPFFFGAVSDFFKGNNLLKK